MRKILQGFRIRQKKHNFWYYPYVGDCNDNDDNDNNDNENDNDSDNNDDNDNVDDQHEAVVSCTHWSLIGKGPYQYWSTYSTIFSIDPLSAIVSIDLHILQLSVLIHIFYYCQYWSTYSTIVGINPLSV